MTDGPQNNIQRNLWRQTILWWGILTRDKYVGQVYSEGFDLCEIISFARRCWPCRRRCDIQMVSGTPAVRSANAMFSLRQRCRQQTLIDQSGAAPTQPAHTACELCRTQSSCTRTCFVTESMSRMYRSCSWRTPATTTRRMRTQPWREYPPSANSRRAIATARDLIALLKTIELFGRSLGKTT